METEFIIYLIICGLLSVISLWILVNFPFAEVHAIESDDILKSYEYEITNPRSDGWTVIAYKSLYEQRVIKLLKGYGVKKFWWKFYLLTKNIKRHV